MSIDTYERIAGITAVDDAIEKSEKRLASNEKPIEASKALKDLRRKHFE